MNVLQIFNRSFCYVSGITPRENATLKFGLQVNKGHISIVFPVSDIIYMYTTFLKITTAFRHALQFGATVAFHIRTVHLSLSQCTRTCVYVLQSKQSGYVNLSAQQ